MATDFRTSEANFQRFAKYIERFTAIFPAPVSFACGELGLAQATCVGRLRDALLVFRNHREWAPALYDRYIAIADRTHVKSVDSFAVTLYTKPALGSSPSTPPVAPGLSLDLASYESPMEVLRALCILHAAGVLRAKTAFTSPFNPEPITSKYDVALDSLGDDKYTLL